MKCELAQHCMGFIGQQQYVISVSLDFERQLSHLGVLIILHFCINVKLYNDSLYK